jgi:ABC-type dipeptide/oligopeptide/nickel transport system permease subunit
MKRLHSMKFLFKDKLTSMASVLLILFVFLAIFGPWVAPYPKEGRGTANIDTLIRN